MIGQRKPSPAKLCVMQVNVVPEHIWFACPHCQEPLEGFLSDPRGIKNVDCQACGEEFDVPASAALVLR